MKKRSFLTSLRPGGILRWSTVCILAGGLGSCDRGVRYVATEQDAEMAATQTQIEKLDSEKSKLIKGEVANNFHIPRVGYYHAEVRNFFEHPYGFEKDGRYFINGAWQDQMMATSVATSHPSPEALKKVEAALEEEQKLAKNQPSAQQHGGGFGMGNALMMYWLLAGNRGMFSPGNGFRQASGQAGGWQQDVDNRRSSVSRYAAANPGYQRMVEQSRASGTSVRPGQSVRGGFGSSRSSTAAPSGGGSGRFSVGG
ncbi:MAG: hypothetical protein V4584_01705 [Verrucomicrobiota bacterium]